jgi:hypothetical protein
MIFAPSSFLAAQQLPLPLLIWLWLQCASSASVRSGVGRWPESVSSSAVAAATGTAAGVKVRSLAEFTSPSTPYSPAPLSARGVAATAGFGAESSTPSSAKKKKKI